MMVTKLPSARLIIATVCGDWSVVRLLSNVKLYVYVYLDVTLRNANQGYGEGSYYVLYCGVTGSLDPVARMG